MAKDGQQQHNKTPKATGFHTNPERINRKGRPKRGETIRDLMFDFLNKAPQGSKVTYKEILVRRAYKLAVDKGDINAMKLIWNYIDGMPIQNIKADVTEKPLLVVGLAEGEEDKNE